MTNLLRRYVTQHIETTQGYRSWYIGAYGQELFVRKVTEESKNVYGDKSADETVDLHAIPFLINWDEYNRLLEFSDASTHDDVPLTAQVRIEDDLPRGSLVQVPFISSDGKESVQEVLYKIISIRIKHNLMLHSKEVIMAPERRLQIESETAPDTSYRGNAFEISFSGEFD